MTITELGNELSKMYDQAHEGEKVAMIHLFGIRYSKYIRENGYVANDIIKSTMLKNGSKINESYYAEINKGVNLAKYVIEKEKLIKLINDNWNNLTTASTG